MNEPHDITLRPVDSTMFSRVGYDEKTWTLVLEFQNSLRLAYQEVPPEVADEFLSAESLGKYYNANVKGKYQAVGEEETEGQSRHRQTESVVEMQSEINRISSSATDAVVAAISPSREADDDPTIPKDDELAKQTVGEVLGPLEPPKTPADALRLLGEQGGIIQATINQSVEFAKDALKVKVSDAGSYTDAGEKLKFLVLVKDRAVGFLDPIREVLLQPYRVAQTNLKAATEPLDTAVAHIKAQRMVWATEQERLAEIERQRLQREAEEKARQEQEALSQQLTLGAVEQAIAEGDTETAEGLLANPIKASPVYVPPVHVAPEVPKESGISKRSNWIGELTSIEDLILDIAEGIKSMRAGKNLAGHAPVTFVKLNETAVNQSAKALKKAFSYPGLRAWDKQTESVRRGK